MSDRKSYLANIERRRAKRAANRRGHVDKYAGPSRPPFRDFDEMVDVAAEARRG